MSDLTNKISEEELKRTIFEKYKIFWMLNHGITIKDISKLAKEWVGDCDTSEVSLEDYLEEQGFNGGSLWACFQEFLDNEFWERGFIENILSGSQNLLKSYIQQPTTKVVGL